MSIWTWLFGSTPKTPAEQMIEGAAITRDLSLQRLRTAAKNYRLSETRPMGEVGPNVMARFTEKDLEANVPLSKAKVSKRRDVLRFGATVKARKKVKPRYQPAKARKVLERFKAVKTAKKANARKRKA